MVTLPLRSRYEPEGSLKRAPAAVFGTLIPDKWSP